MLRECHARVTQRAQRNAHQRREEKRIKEQEDNPLPPSLSTDEFAAAWSAWKAHRKELKKPLRPTMEAEQLKMLAGIGHDRALMMIRHTIAMGWQGLREPECKSAPRPQLAKGIADDL